MELTGYKLKKKISELKDIVTKLPNEAGGIK